MSSIQINFSEPLKYFLANDRKSGLVELTFKGRQSIKHLIESVGVPHTEAGVINVDGKIARITQIAEDGSRVEVDDDRSYPPFHPRFILDGHLGRLAAYLRMLGFDCLYNPEYDDDRLVQLMGDEPRILLSRDRRLLMRKAVVFGYCPRSLMPKEQLQEVIHRYNLLDFILPFQRCIRCNQFLVDVEKEIILDRLEPLTRKYFDEFRICPDCSQIYWKGSHLDKMQALIDQIVKK